MFEDVFSGKETDEKAERKGSVTGKVFYEEGERDHQALFKDFLARAEASEFGDFAEFYRALQDAAWQFTAAFARQSWQNARRLSKQRRGRR